MKEISANGSCAHTLICAYPYLAFFFHFFFYLLCQGHPGIIEKLDLISAQIVIHGLELAPAFAIGNDWMAPVVLSSSYPHPLLPLFLFHQYYHTSCYESCH